MKQYLWWVGLLLLLFSTAAAAAAEQPVAIHVQAEGDVRMTPDVVVVWIGVQSEGDDASSALRSSYRIVEDITDIFLAYAPEERLKTSEFFLYRSEHWDPTGNTFVPGPFVVRHVFEVPVTELDRATEMIDRATLAGANVIQNIQYGVSDDTEAWELAYARALDNAWWKGQLLAPEGTVLQLAEIRDTYLSLPRFAAQGGSDVTDLPRMFMPGQMKLAVHLDVIFHAISSAETANDH